MFSGVVHEYTCGSCGFNGSSFTDWCQCENCGKRVDCTKFEAIEVTDKDKGESNGN
ncbi:hypothetical protein HZI73_22480 [Vallitalea pronyensis]|uniref:Uncharacterized protein n=1 Tax=Vallitalea pronyensis TaxID=1348613 RepID=A0A8J8SIX4_9FIRM|nr:hypothetical protein [Vallitalea pronyensis]QUI24897.1 hypothetical protein HZI73_22480 [Vallitalea pronyensis]